MLKQGKYSAKVSSASDGMGGYVLRIQPAGQAVIEIHIDDPVIQAEVADLNQDGYSEIMVFTQSVGSGSYGNVIAYSSQLSQNKGKSWSEVCFPELTKELAEGYMGHDSFSLKNNYLVREFPLYLEDDINANPTGGTRLIQYRLVDDEALPKFVVDKVIEF